MEDLLEQGQKDFRGKPELTLESFVVGDSNIVAFAAAKEVSESPGIKYNPLFIWGNVGQGKSHILSGIGWEFKRRNPDGIVDLVDGEEFSEEFADVRDKRAFREKYSQPDVLLVDDFHVLTEQAKAELLRIFEALQSAKKQLVLGSLRSPEELDIEERLRSRIEGGLVCKILPPDLETRIAILKQKAKKAGVGIQENILEEIAAKVTMNVRKLEGAINRLVVLSKARDEMISSEFASSALRDMIPEVPREEVLAYQEPAEGGGSEFSDFISDVAKTISRISPEPSEEAKMREAYAEKMYVWEMKGFSVDRLKAALSKSMDMLASAFVSFTSDIQRLIELQNRFGGLDAKRFPHEASAVERLLFDPDAVDELMKRIEDLESKLSTAAPDLIEGYTFDRLVVDSFNEEAYEICRSIADAPSTARELVFFWGEEGVGKSHLINAVAKEVYENWLDVNVFLLHGEIFVDDLKIERGRRARGRLRERCLETDFLLVDDVHKIFGNKYSADEFMAILDQRIVGGKTVFLVSDEPPEKTYDDPGFARLISKGVVCHISEPTEDVKQEITRQYLLRKDIEFSQEDIDDVCASVEANLWELMDRLDRMVEEKRGEAVSEGVPVVEEEAEEEVVTPTVEEEAEAEAEEEVLAPTVEEEIEAEEEVVAPTVEEEAEAEAEEEVVAPTVEEEIEAEEEVVAPPVEEEAEAEVEEEVVAPPVEEEAEAEVEEEVVAPPVEEEAEAAIEEEVVAPPVEEEAEAEVEEEVVAPAVEEEVQDTLEPAGEPRPELELEAFVEAAEQVFTPSFGSEIQLPREVEEEVAPPPSEQKEVSGEFAPPSEAEVEALLEAADEIFAPPPGIEIEPSSGVREEGPAPSLAEVFTPPEVEKKKWPSEPRAVDEIMDASWEIEGERLIESP